MDGQPWTIHPDPRQTCHREHLTPPVFLAFPCAVTENGLDKAANSDTVGAPSGVYGPHPGSAGPPRSPITSHRDMGQVVPASEAIARLIFIDHILRNPAGA